MASNLEENYYKVGLIEKNKIVLDSVTYFNKFVSDKLD